ncbi:metaxin-2 isoform X5 [Rhipicephalus microplus]|uniref:metaxin-2 isoform X5 n=1 Tax=Rhipicephalus microplus TaxID=6941 RepID=UPI003F6D0378
MPSVLLADSIAVELGANQPWPDDAKLLQSFEKSQVLLPESTSSLGVQTFLRMAGLDHEVEMRPNVESISPSGNVPVLKCGPFVIAEMDSIVAFVNTKGIQLTQNMSVQQKADIRAYMSLINTVLVNAELYICWANDATYDKVTKSRYGSVYPWPLNHILSFRKKKQILAKLSVCEWSEKSLEEDALSSACVLPMPRCLKKSSLVVLHCLNAWAKAIISSETSACPNMEKLMYKKWSCVSRRSS